MKKILLAASMIAILIPFATFADMIPEGYHPVSNCVTIDNMSSYSNYNFYIYGTTHNAFYSAMPVTENKECFGDVNGVLMAIKKDDASKIVRLSNLTSVKDNGENTGEWPKLKENAEIVSWSTVKIAGEGSLPDTNTTVETDFILHVDSISKTSIEAHQVSKKNLTSAQVEAQQTNGKEANEGQSPYVIAGIVILGLLGAGAAYRMWGKK